MTAWEGLAPHLNPTLKNKALSPQQPQQLALHPVSLTTTNRRERFPIFPGPLLRWVSLLLGTMAGHSKARAPDPHSDPLAKLSSIPGESLTYASMTFKLSEDKSNQLAENHPADFDPIVYAQIKVTN
ncbi:PREDICTED: transmembrane protein C1orf162 homolog isoform X3 [Colobus angolensis palliatus]|uniref:transmembrane protein C1orf162 homolog isoform X3 n=1 Tax=Colobus angolensis palliatus TaxID=336983 RepID=UPI0005F51325|nr:PREDICTED: transmembrane protein C1orf162 homolog isoform X3 [Colobus angolensis palliatus]